MRITHLWTQQMIKMKIERKKTEKGRVEFKLGILHYV